MTNEEAIEVLKDWDGYFIGHSSDDVNEALDMAIKALDIELLTDTEQRIFLIAMDRERKVCRMVDDTYDTNPYDSNIPLVQVCNSIIRKVKKIWE